MVRNIAIPGLVLILHATFAFNLFWTPWDEFYGRIYTNVEYIYPRLVGSDIQDSGKNTRGNNAAYCYDSMNKPVSVGQRYRLVCHICMCGPYGRPTSCSENICNQERPRTVAGTSANKPANIHVPNKIPNQAPVKINIPFTPRVAPKTPHQAPILSKHHHGTLAAKTPGKQFQHAEPSITAVAALKGKQPKRSKYA